MGIFADDTVLICRHKDPQITTDRLQLHLDMLENWLHKWRIKENEQKSTHVTHTLRPVSYTHLDVYKRQSQQLVFVF